MLGAGDFADDGALLGFSGILVDLTEAVRRTTAREVDEAMELMSQSRPAIEQAKGALMISYGLDADRAFQLLRSYSQRTNVKLRDVARNVVEALVDRDLPLGSRATWDELATDLTADTSEERSG
jgi:ANTAR domain